MNKLITSTLDGVQILMSDEPCAVSARQKTAFVFKIMLAIYVPLAVIAATLAFINTSYAMLVFTISALSSVPVCKYIVIPALERKFYKR